jgi:hypothetical protein
MGGGDLKGDASASPAAAVRHRKTDKTRAMSAIRLKTALAAWPNSQRILRSSQSSGVIVQFRVAWFVG